MEKVKVTEKPEATSLEEISTEPAETDLVELEDELEGMIPQMNVSVPTQEQDVSKLIEDAELVGIYTEILNNIREDREQVSDFIDNMAEMVINGGDSTTSSKEAFVNLVKIKSDMSDKMSKVADLMTRLKLKERDTFPRYLAAHQNNTINIGDSGKRRALLEAIDKAKKKKD